MRLLNWMFSVPGNLAMINGVKDVDFVFQNNRYEWTQSALDLMAQGSMVFKQQRDAGKYWNQCSLMSNFIDPATGAALGAINPGAPNLNSLEAAWAGHYNRARRLCLYVQQHRPMGGSDPNYDVGSLARRFTSNQPINFRILGRRGSQIDRHRIRRRF